MAALPSPLLPVRTLGRRCTWCQSQDSSTSNYYSSLMHFFSFYLFLKVSHDTINSRTAWKTNALKLTNSRPRCLRDFSECGSAGLLGVSVGTSCFSPHSFRSMSFPSLIPLHAFPLTDSDPCLSPH